MYLGSDGQSVWFELKNVETGVSHQATLSSLLDGGVFRLRIDEQKSDKKRFDPSNLILLPGVKGSKLSVASQSEQGFTVQSVDEAGQVRNKIVVSSSPFRLDVYSGEDLVIVANQRGLFNFEHYRPKPQGLFGLLNTIVCGLL